MNESLDVVVSTLNMCGFEFCIKDLKGKSVYESEDFRKIKKCPTITDIDIFCYDTQFYGYEVKKMDIDDSLYEIELYSNITKYQNCIIELKKDVLTNLPNRSEIENFIDNRIVANQSYIVVMSDIDDFKQINDTYGHDVGDDVLQEFGSVLNEYIVGDNFVGRYGGEEFQMFFKTDNIRYVENILAQIRNKISMGKYRDTLLFSSGIAIYDGNLPVRDVIKQADKALYFVKQNGKNYDILYDESMKIKRL